MAGLLDGSYDVPLLPSNIAPAGVDLGSAVVLPPGGNVFYVRGDGTNTTGYTYDPPGLPDRLLPSINTALRQCVASRGDRVVCLPGHAETILNDGDAWSNIVAGAQIVSLGRGASRATITFGHANAQIDVKADNVLIQNFVFKAAGPAGTTALTVANPFNVTGANCHFIGNEAEVGIDADQLCTDFFKLSAVADGCLFASNRIYGALLSSITTVIKTTGACDQVRIVGNRISAAVATAATGVLIDVSNAAIIENDIINNILENKTASSKFVIKPHATSTGLVSGNFYMVGDGSTAPAVAGWSTYTTTYKFCENYCVTDVSVSGILSPAADA